jgi:hypothetical protein
MTVTIGKYQDRTGFFTALSDKWDCSIWDSYRSIHPLLTLVDPQSQSLMMRSLVDIARVLRREAQMQMYSWPMRI